MRSTYNSMRIIVTVSLVLFVFFLFPWGMLLGGIIFLIGWVCFKAGLSARDAAEENKPKSRGFRTYAQRQAETVEQYTKKGFNPKDPEHKARNDGIRREVEKNRRAAEEEMRREKDDSIQDTP